MTLATEDVEGFIADLRTLNPKAKDYDAKVKARCLGYLSRFSDKSGEGGLRVALASKRQAITRARNAVRAAFGDDHLALVGGKEKRGYLRLKDEDQATVHAQTRANMVEQHYARRPVVVEQHIERARAILQRVAQEPPAALNAKGGHNQEYVAPLELAAALIAVAGRRPIEILQDRAPFTETGTDFRSVAAPSKTLFDGGVAAKLRWSVMFAGQRKTRGAESAQTAPYEIPVLVEPELVLRGIDALRARDLASAKRDGFKPMVELTAEAVGSRALKTLGNYCKSASSGGYELAANRFGYHDRDGEPFTPKDLRAVYACCAYELYAPSRLSWNAYTAKILGHSTSDLLTSFSYDLAYPWGSKRAYVDEVTEAAHDTFDALLVQRDALDPKDEYAASTRERIDQSIETVRARLEGAKT